MNPNNFINFPFMVYLRDHLTSPVITGGGTADTEIKAPLGGSPELSQVPGVGLNIAVHAAHVDRTYMPT